MIEYTYTALAITTNQSAVAENMGEADAGAAPRGRTSSSVPQRRQFIVRHRERNQILITFSVSTPSTI